jgi:hypothetical protein
MKKHLETRISKLERHRRVGDPYGGYTFVDYEQAAQLGLTYDQVPAGLKAIHRDICFSRNLREHHVRTGWPATEEEIVPTVTQRGRAMGVVKRVIDHELQSWRHHRRIFALVLEPPAHMAASAGLQPEGARWCHGCFHWVGRGEPEQRHARGESRPGFTPGSVSAEFVLAPPAPLTEPGPIPAYEP